MRTLDVGSDKSLPCFPVKEGNPALGWRGIRTTLDHPAIMSTQMRAMLRASVGLDNLRLLLPMVSSVDEVDHAREILERATLDVAREGREVTRHELGVMLEEPAALHQTESLAKRWDFFSLGTDDLTQCLLAVDRHNPRAAPRHDSLHPAVLRALRSAVAECKRLNKPVSVCGDMAGEPVAARLLAAMGVRCLSMAPPHLPAVKAAIRPVILADAEQQLSQVLPLETAAAVRAHLAGLAAQRADPPG
jgi:phosphotransferase system enzyme I (PtsP)